MRILVLEMTEENKKMAENLFSDRNDTQVRVLFPDDIADPVDATAFDIVFIPLKTDGIDGTDLCRKIKQANPNSIVYAYSRFLHHYDPNTLETMGFDGFIKKPAKKETLMTAVEGAIAKLHRLTFQGQRPN